MLRAFKGLTLRSELNLLLSALCDTLFYAISGAALNPRLTLGGIFFFKIRGLGVAVVRGGTDDLYHLLPGREGDVDAFIRSRLREGGCFRRCWSQRRLLHAGCLEARRGSGPRLRYRAGPLHSNASQG